MDEQQARDLISRARAIRRAAHLPLADLASYVGVPAGLLGSWERRTPDPGRLSYRDRLAVRRWANFLEQLDGTGG